MRAFSHNHDATGGGLAGDPGEDARRALRVETGPAHAAIDALYARFDLTGRQGYGAFLLGHAAAYLPTEAALEAAGAGALVSGWSLGRRGPALCEDLARLGLAPPAALTPPRFSNEAEVLGGLYVLEGSRLGGAVLRRSVGEGLPTAFLAPGNPADWRALQALLRERLRSPAALERAVSAALAVFAMFERSARNRLGSTSL